MKRIFQTAALAVLGVGVFLMPATAKADNLTVVYSSGYPAAVRHVGYVPDRRPFVVRHVAYRPMHHHRWGHANRGWHKGWDRRDGRRGHDEVRWHDGDRREHHR